MLTPQVLPRRISDQLVVGLAGWVPPGWRAQLMGVPVNQLWTWRRAGLLPNTRTTWAGHNRYARDDLLHVLRLRGGRKILPPNTAACHGDPTTGGRHVAAVPRKLTGRYRRAGTGGRDDESGSDQEFVGRDEPDRGGRDAQARPE